MGLDQELLDFLDFVEGPVTAKIEPKGLPEHETSTPEEFLDWRALSAKPLVESVAPVVRLPDYTVEFRPFTVEEELRAIRKTALQLLSTGPFSFLSIRQFEGNGIYALYYQGPDSDYEALRSLGSTCPIYIGMSRTENNDGLYSRLRTHAKTLGMTGIGLENMTFRFVRLPDTLVNFAEPNLIRLFDPLWNDHLKGFGEKPGKGRSTFGRDNQMVSPWDTKHPGRPTGGAAPRDLESVRTFIQERVPKCRRAYEEAMTSINLLSTEPIDSGD
jgi:hypothetical protein